MLAKMWLEQVEMNSKSLAPFAPRKRGEIFKIKVLDSGLATLHFKIHFNIGSRTTRRPLGAPSSTVQKQEHEKNNRAKQPAR